MKAEQDGFSEESENEELYEHHRIVADSGQKPLRVDKFLGNLLPNTSRNKIQQAAAAGNIHVNQKAVKSNYRVKPSDVVQVVLSYPPREIELIPENIPLNIIYEDDQVIVINKTAGIVVHPGYGNYTGTLVNGLIYHFNNLPGKDEVRPGLVHRLDKDTSGIMVIAADEYAMAHLARQFFERTTNRAYQALVWGNVEEDQGTITGHIGRSKKDRKVFTVYPEGDEGKHAVTHYRVLERFGYTTLVECRLETGRTHQIRVHMKHLGHPLFNDKEYGGDHILKGTTFTKYKQFVANCFELCPRQALHAKTLGFEHPRTHERLSFDSDLPPDMQGLIDKWRHYAKHKLN
ncbi:MAG TPA: RNA pseudouridine synthase [Cryomorphaceae bacterium]|nr:RNA pseudouridine synthase [Owenweeksia sp.]HCQ15600.1 RNA pseudouridine synthase [Cryomorphaceae bacterium]|tara:strand:- start:8284 stop:9321 length:1038 start_codon:yes stop_codon:yes gene_type:complete